MQSALHFEFVDADIRNSLISIYGPSAQILIDVWNSTQVRSPLSLEEVEDVFFEGIL